jgi:hypothetical protein
MLIILMLMVFFGIIIMGMSLLSILGLLWIYIWMGYIRRIGNGIFGGIGLMLAIGMIRGR